MSSSSKKDINAYIRKNIKIPSMKTKELVLYLNTSLVNITKQLNSFFGEKSISNYRKFHLGSVKTDFSVSYGISRSNDSITLADWIFDLPKMIKVYILKFIIVKESILHYLNANIDYSFSEIEEVITNITTILLLAEVFSINAFDSPLIASIRARIYPFEICGKDNSFWDNLLRLLFLKKIPFSDVLELAKEIFSNRTVDISQGDIIKVFSKWIFDTTVKEEDVINPIYLTDRLITVVDQLLEFGYENGSAPNIASKIGIHENTVRNQMNYLTEHYSTFWRPELNLEKLNLNNYFLKIQMKDTNSFDKVNQILKNIPYVKNLYHGKYPENQILYSPQIFCPHVIANNLDAKLLELQKKDIIEDFTLQIVREKKHFAAISNYPFNPNKKTFQNLIEGKHNQILRKYVFSHSKKEFSMEIGDDVPFDYNLLFFLSILRNKYLLRSRYGVAIAELQKLFELNDISNVDVIKQTDFINQIEIRARKRGLLTYCLFIRSLTRKGSDILVTEIKDIDDYPKKLLDEVIEKLRVFSFLGQITLHDRIVHTMPGVSHQHYIKEIIQNELNKVNIKAEYYTIGIAQSRLISMHDLYDFDEQKWKIVGI